MIEWEKYTSSKFELMCFKGNHFFIFDNDKIRNIVFNRTRFTNKILAYNLCIVWNSIFGEICELAQIKKIVF